MLKGSYFVILRYFRSNKIIILIIFNIWQNCDGIVRFYQPLAEKSSMATVVLCSAYSVCCCFICYFMYLHNCYVIHVIIRCIILPENKQLNLHCISTLFQPSVKQHSTNKRGHSEHTKNIPHNNWWRTQGFGSGSRCRDHSTGHNTIYGVILTGQTRRTRRTKF